jgi:hypothetical protein
MYKGIQVSETISIIPLTTIMLYTQHRNVKIVN